MRVIYVDVGNMSPEQAKSYLDQVVENFRNKKNYVTLADGVEAYVVSDNIRIVDLGDK